MHEFEFEQNSAADFGVILAGNKDNYKSLDEYEFGQNSAADFGVSCP